MVALKKRKLSESSKSKNESKTALSKSDSDSFVRLNEKAQIQCMASIRGKIWYSAKKNVYKRSRSKVIPREVAIGLKERG